MMKPIELLLLLLQGRLQWSESILQRPSRRVCTLYHQPQRLLGCKGLLANHEECQHL